MREKDELDFKCTVIGNVFISVLSCVFISARMTLLSPGALCVAGSLLLALTAQQFCSLWCNVDSQVFSLLPFAQTRNRETILKRLDNYPDNSLPHIKHPAHLLSWRTSSVTLKGLNYLKSDHYFGTSMTRTATRSHVISVCVFQDVEFSPSWVQTLEVKTMTARCSSAGSSVPSCNGRQSASHVVFLCCHLACMGWMYRSGAMVTPNQGTDTMGRHFFTLTELEIVSLVTV